MKTDECYQCDTEYIVGKKDKGLCPPCDAEWRARDKQDILVCRMYNRYKWWTFWWRWPFGNWFYKYHEKHCVDIAQVNGAGKYRDKVVQAIEDEIKRVSNPMMVDKEYIDGLNRALEILGDHY